MQFFEDSARVGSAVSIYIYDICVWSCCGVISGYCIIIDVIVIIVISVFRCFFYW